ncbi:hypothetical protein OGATHE_001212 [Ogataea polymorpha]|uniref:Uncharacterized protein n=1 Tax=Ogataea polymorpha TaxID=460523 RepID=A0A9P8PSC6_9ASCO|nr:hypothetical protein OGATHE_001212 [Ogataea polymorpha]
MMSTNGGIVDPMITRVNIVLMTELNTAANTRGNAESILDMSWLNLLMTLPSGVVSKNDIGDASTAVAISLCNFFDARIEHQLHMIMALKSVNKPELTPNRAYTPTYRPTWSLEPVLSLCSPQCFSQ